jgi:hypothetical protein
VWLKRHPVTPDHLYVVHIPGFGGRDRPSLTIREVLHRRTDLSTFVVHLTRDTEARSARENLESVIRERTLRAGEPKGWATWERFGLGEDALESQRVVCFTETPLEHTYSMFAEIAGRSVRFRPYGIAFPKMVARLMGINPVWYIDMSRPPGGYREWALARALNELVEGAAGDFAAQPVSRIAPFIEGMGDFRNGNGGKLREFSWEREWRHLGDLSLDGCWSKTLWLCPEDELEEFAALIGDGAHCIDPAWGLERIIGHLMGMGEDEMTPFGTH